MILESYQYLPFQIDPIVFTVGSFAVRWYSLSYIVSFCVVYLLLRWRIKKGERPEVISHQSSVIKKSSKSDKDDRLPIADYSSIMLDLLLISALGALLGGRLGYVLFYNLPYYLDNPFAIVSPYGDSGELTGIYGMSFYGGAAGALLAGYLYTRWQRLDFLAWADFIVPSIGAGYFFGRIGNFLNGELYGRVTSKVWGMYFPSDSLGHLRYPSQLYEALGEGLLLFLVLWSIRNKKFFTGRLLLIYLGSYGFIRFCLEFFRSPGSEERLFFGWMTTGQLLGLILVLIMISCVIMKSMNGSLIWRRRR